MKTKLPTTVSPDDLADFTPVPRKTRSDGWTPERQRAFIAALADTGCVSRAAHITNMASEGAYALRRAPGAEGFRRAWAAALNHGVQRITDIAFERAIEGVAVPLFNNKGEKIGERRRYNDRLLMFILRHHDPDRYGASSPGAIGGRISPAKLSELREQWVAEEAAKEEEDGYANRERLAGELIAMHTRMAAIEDWRHFDALGLYGPPDPHNKRRPVPPEIPSPFAKPGYEVPHPRSPQPADETWQHVQGRSATFHTLLEPSLYDIDYDIDD